MLKSTKARANGAAGVATLRRLEEEELRIGIVGVTPVIPEKWSEKAKAMMPGHPDKPQISAAKGKHEPEKEAELRVYRLPDGRMGMPAVAMKAAMVGACRLFDGLTMTEAKMLFHVVGEGRDPEGTELIPLTHGAVNVREDITRNAGGTSQLCYRKEFCDWRADIHIRYLPSKISAESLVALLDAAGRGGWGGWRPSAPKSCTGTYGQWRVEGEEVDE